ncbi:Hypothetical protein NTJ_05409 [Nesidiocoris tenuis]|uniref:Uncharacterized protein n=1 Tax=Nesidiocoris tenuis TaxID=355587 RepID=A0ABN7AK19_9HEMI|nr:Hypothetical protein NTJ_05409 [Nesidiocoris tenuis]
MNRCGLKPEQARVLYFPPSTTNRVGTGRGAGGDGGGLAEIRGEGDVRRAGDTGSEGRAVRSGSPRNDTATSAVASSSFPQGAGYIPFSRSAISPPGEVVDVHLIYTSHSS